MHDVRTNSWLAVDFGVMAESVIGIFLLFIVSAIGTPGRLMADEPKSLLLWEKGAPNALGTEAKDRPQALAYLLESEPAKKPLLIIYPGGGYGGLAMDHEGHQIAAWANHMGMAALICDYRHRGKGYGHPSPLEDAQRAVRMARHHANQWNIDPERIGVIGFSAGGHLASSVLTHLQHPSPIDDEIGRQNPRPNFGILCYPVIAFDKPYTHRGSQQNLLGANADPSLVASLSNETRVSADTPPTFLFHTQEDSAVPPQNSLVFYQAMLDHGVKGELHLFQKGRHGVGLSKGLAGTEQWSVLCEEWLRNLGMIDQRR